MSDIKYNSEVIFSTLLDRGIIKVTGDDAARFLQTLITNDINSSPLYAMMLSPQGRYLFDFFISEAGEEYWLETDKSSVKALAAKLKLYKLRAKILIEEVSDNYSLYYSHAPLDIEKVVEYRDPRFDKLGFRTIAANHPKIAPLDQAKKNLYLCDKYHYAIPDGETDLIYDKSMPQEYGMDSLHCIDYHKGCYVGQEVISRTKYQGVIRKQIFKIAGDEELSGLVQGEPIVAGEYKVGVLCSTYQNLGIGLVRLEDYEKHKGTQCYIGNKRVGLEKVKWMEEG